MTNIHKQNPRNIPNTKKTATKSQNVVIFVNNKNKNNKSHKKNSDPSNNTKNITTKDDSITEIQLVI